MPPQNDNRQTNVGIALDILVQFVPIAGRLVAFGRVAEATAAGGQRDYPVSRLNDYPCFLGFENPLAFLRNYRVPVGQA